MAAAERVEVQHGVHHFGISEGLLAAAGTRSGQRREPNDDIASKLVWPETTEEKMPPAPMKRRAILIFTDATDLYESRERIRQEREQADLPTVGGDGP